MINHPNRSNRYIIISPRGFSNEVNVRFGSAEAVRIASEIINDDVNAWAKIVPSTHPEVRAAKRREAAAKAGTEYHLPEHLPCRLHEGDVAPHRPVMAPSHGPRYRGGPSLPEGYGERSDVVSY